MKSKLPRVCLISILLLVVLCFFNKPAFAANGNLPSGVVIGDDKGFEVEHDGNYLFDIKNLRPGSKVKRTISIGNYSETNSTPITIDMKMDYDKHKPIIKGKENLLEVVQVKFKVDDKKIYEGSLDFSGLKKVRNKKDPIKIKTFKTGEAATLTAEFEVPEDVDPSKWVASNSAEFVLIFTATRDGVPIKEPDPKVKKPGLAGILPKTGEELAFLLLGIAVGFLLIILAVKVFIKERKEQRN